MSTESIYKIIFVNQDDLYEIYAKEIVESDMFGFLEIEEIIFGETSKILVDPSEERLKMEFSGVTRTYIPVHSIVRIDEVNKHGVAKIVEKKPSSNVSSFPMRQLQKTDE